jgi:hypothetical protein
VTNELGCLSVDTVLSNPPNDEKEFNLAVESSRCLHRVDNFSIIASVQTCVFSMSKFAWHIYLYSASLFSSTLVSSDALLLKDTIITTICTVHNGTLYIPAQSGRGDLNFSSTGLSACADDRFNQMPNGR